LFTICEKFDRTHIPLVKHLSKNITLEVIDFYNGKKVHIIVMQVLHDANITFWNVCWAIENFVPL
jgi:hypothetical protein